MPNFINREQELKTLNSTRANFIVVFGRRRVGKTALIEQWGRRENFAYSQAIEASQNTQIEQLTSDLSSILPKGIAPKTWQEFFATLSIIKTSQTIVIDEFPYLVHSNPSLPSILQKWVDHDQPKKLQLVLLGSSQTMMHSTFLQSDSPLYERADLVLKIEPMSYKHYCEAVNCDSQNVDSFLKFSMMGGIPRYWNYSQNERSVLDVAESLFFGKSARLEDEPERLLKDEGVGGQQAKAIFEILGRGSNKPSEIAARMGIPQTALSKPLGILLHSNLITRVVPFGESSRNAKTTLYRLDDHALRFWYQVYSPHRSRWHLYKKEEKLKLIRDHAGYVLENEYRKLFPEASIYWEGSKVEFDCVRYASNEFKNLTISEIKLTTLSKKSKDLLTMEISQKFAASKLASKYSLKNIEVLDVYDVLKKLSNGF